MQTHTNMWWPIMKFTTPYMYEYVISLCGLHFFPSVIVWSLKYYIILIVYMININFNYIHLHGSYTLSLQSSSFHTLTKTNFDYIFLCLYIQFMCLHMHPLMLHMQYVVPRSPAHVNHFSEKYGAKIKWMEIFFKELKSFNQLQLSMIQISLNKLKKVKHIL